ncbi:MAG: hypothetical protein AB7W37_10225 [Syntrophobacteraceae bacterium]
MEELIAYAFERREEIDRRSQETFNSTLRGRNAASREKTNTCAKSKAPRQKALDVYRVVHNFIRPHRTTKRTPAVVPRNLDHGPSWEEIFMHPLSA